MKEHAWSGVKVCAGCEGYLQEVKHADCQQADVQQVKHVDASRHNAACNGIRHHVATHITRNCHGNKLGKLLYEAGQLRAAASAAKLVQLSPIVACAQDERDQCSSSSSSWCALRSGKAQISIFLHFTIYFSSRCDGKNCHSHSHTPLGVVFLVLDVGTDVFHSHVLLKEPTHTTTLQNKSTKHYTNTTHTTMAYTSDAGTGASDYMDEDGSNSSSPEGSRSCGPSLEEALEDVASRFLLNMPSGEKPSVERVFMQIQQVTIALASEFTHNTD